jgi:hypothetical protein
VPVRSRKTRHGMPYPRWVCTVLLLFFLPAARAPEHEQAAREGQVVCGHTPLPVRWVRGEQGITTRM